MNIGGEALPTGKLSAKVIRFKKPWYVRLFNFLKGVGK